MKKANDRWSARKPSSIVAPGMLASSVEGRGSARRIVRHPSGAAPRAGRSQSTGGRFLSVLDAGSIRVLAQGQPAGRRRRVNRWTTAILVGLIVASAWGYRMSAAHGTHTGAQPAVTSVALDSLHPISMSRPGISNNYSSVAVLVHRKLITFNGKTIDHGIMFSLVPGHGGTSSEADITFSLANRYDRLSGLVFASGGSNPAPLAVEIQDVSSRTTPPKDVFSGQADPSGHLPFTALVRGVSTLKVSTSTSFDCVCDSAATVLVVGMLTGAQTQPLHR